MELTISLDTLSRVGSSPIALNQGDVIPLSVSFQQGGKTIELPHGSSGKVGIKKDLGATEFLAYSDAWRQAGVGSSSSYLFDLNLDTLELQAALETSTGIAAIMEVQVCLDGYVVSISTPVKFSKNLFSGTASEPSHPDYKASQANAEAGADNAKWMTPLRTFQAISAWVNANLSFSWASVDEKPESFPPSAHEHSWASITERPESFPPSSHEHSIADVEGLQSALDGKEAAGVARPLFPLGSSAFSSGGQYPESYTIKNAAGETIGFINLTYNQANKVTGVSTTDATSTAIAKGNWTISYDQNNNLISAICNN